MTELLDRLRAARVVPVVRMHDRANAATGIGWLREAGISVFEITMTIPGAVDLIRELAADRSLLIGAGTVPDAAACRACLEAGAKFIVSPWVDPTLSAPCREARAALLMGTMTPTEVRAALAGGADAVKVFPASSAGGPSHVRALVSVFPGVAFCPTGGVDPGNVDVYLKAGAAFVGMGGNLVNEALIAAGDRTAVMAAAKAVLPG